MLPKAGFMATPALWTFFFLPGLSAQAHYSANRMNGTITLSGTSSLHDREMQISDLNCDVVLSGMDQSLKIESVQYFGVPLSIRSHSSIMDKKTYDALKAETYPEIRFKSSSRKEIPLNLKAFEGTLSGNLFLAGRNRPVTLQFSTR